LKDEVVLKAEVPQTLGDVKKIAGSSAAHLVDVCHCGDVVRLHRDGLVMKKMRE
jgi:hypothetical protein